MEWHNKMGHWLLLIKNVPNISQGNVVAYLRCGGKLFNDNFINLQPWLKVKEFWKQMTTSSAKLCRQKYSGIIYLLIYFTGEYASENNRFLTVTAN